MSRRILPFLRSLLRFRLRTLLLAVLVISVGMGVYVNRVKRQQESIAAVKRLGGWAYYDYVISDDPYNSQGKSWAPAWLRQNLGDDYFHTVGVVNMDFDIESGRKNDHLTDEALAHLSGFPRLQVLRLKGSQASDQGLAHVGKLKELRRLWLFDSFDVTDVGVAHLAGCRNLELLYLNHSQVGDEGLRVLSRLPRLTELLLQGNRCTDLGLAHVGQMRQLKTLWLGDAAAHNPNITDAGLIHLATLPKLEELYLDNTAITNAGLVHLQGATALKTLSLRDTLVSDASALQKALPQCRIAAPFPEPVSPGQ
jgi:hypothetical protein